MSAPRRPVIIEAAINGSTKPGTNPTVPREPADVARQALECLDAGAAIVHSHPRSLRPGEDLPDYVDGWSPVMTARPDALLYPTARLAEPVATRAQEWAHHDALASAGLVTMGLVDPGSVNLGMNPDGTVEPPFENLVYANSHAATSYRLSRCGVLGLGPSISIFDPSFLRATVGFLRAGVLPAGSMVKLFFGAEQLFGLRPTVTALEAYMELLAGTGLQWSAAVLGGNVMEDGFAETVVARGGHLRVGLEDLDRPGSRTNAELVTEAADLVTGLGHPVATPDQTREILGLPRR